VIVFLDASALIYLIEGAGPFATRARSALDEITSESPTATMALSRLTWLECRVRPARTRDRAALAAFDEFFARSDLLWVELTRDVVELATEIRVVHGLRTPDALQAASCLQLVDEHVFVTGDAGFRKVSGLRCNVLQ
jgi:predicted nucleic acid-binding protein